MKIFSYPHAGGSASSFNYFKKNFPNHIGEIIPIEIPGRGRRSKESFSKDITDCIVQCLDQLPITEDYILHGHCMGALIAFETIKYLSKNDKNLPKMLIVSGRNAPGYQTEWGHKVAKLEDKDLFNELKSVGGIPKGLSFSMAQQFLSIIKNDQKIVHSYIPDNKMINIPILVLSGDKDFMTNKDALEEWNNFTSETISYSVMRGEHYFIYDQPEIFANNVKNMLEHK